MFPIKSEQVKLFGYFNIQYMYVLKKTKDTDDFSNSTQYINNENDDNNIFSKLLLLSIAPGVLLLSHLGSRIWSTLQPLFS